MGGVKRQIRRPRFHDPQDRNDGFDSGRGHDRENNFGAGPNPSQKIGKVICVPVEFAVGQLARPLDQSHRFAIRVDLGIEHGYQRQRCIVQTLVKEPGYRIRMVAGKNRRDSFPIRFRRTARRHIGRPRSRARHHLSLAPNWLLRASMTLTIPIPCPRRPAPQRQHVGHRRCSGSDETYNHAGRSANVRQQTDRPHTTLHNRQSSRRPEQG
ncbi:hypothetical protein R70199_07301 [Paraburkholderia domus]|nr:hypothetical protein R70199_07301 [Paraburkholderia domus]